MDEQGLEGRSHDYSARITITFDMEVSGRNFESATDDLDRDDVLTELNRSEWDFEIEERY